MVVVVVMDAEASVCQGSLGSRSRHIQVLKGAKAKELRNVNEWFLLTFLKIVSVGTKESKKGGNTPHSSVGTSGE